MKTRRHVFGAIALYACGLALFVPAARYRLPIVIVLIPVAAISIVSWVEWALKRFGGRVRALPEAAWIPASVTLVLCNLPNAYTATFEATPAERALLLSQAYTSQNDNARALEFAERSVQLDAQDFDAHVQLGNVFMAQGQAERAAHEFRVAGRIVPESAAPWVLHSHAMLTLGQYDHAIYNFREALLRNRYHKEAMRDLGRAYMLAGSVDLAIEALTRYLAVGYRDAWATKTLTTLKHLRTQKPTTEPSRAAP